MASRSNWRFRFATCVYWWSSPNFAVNPDVDVKYPGPDGMWMHVRCLHSKCPVPECLNPGLRPGRSCGDHQPELTLSEELVAFVEPAPAPPPAPKLYEVLGSIGTESASDVAR